MEAVTNVTWKCSHWNMFTSRLPMWITLRAESLKKHETEPSWKCDHCNIRMWGCGAVPTATRFSELQFQVCNSMLHPLNLPLIEALWLRVLLPPPPPPPSTDHHVSQHPANNVQDKKEKSGPQLCVAVISLWDPGVSNCLDTCVRGPLSFLSEKMRPLVLFTTSLSW